VPPGCRFRVGGETREWQEGSAWVFDDTIEHEAWNGSDEVRIVLSLDVWRDSMPVDMRILSASLIQLVRIGIRVRGVA